MAIGTGIALLGAAAIGAGASALSGKSQKKAADKAAAAAQQNNVANNALARENRDLIAGKLEPYNQIGLGASNKVNALLANGPYSGGTIDSTFLERNDPGTFENYLDQGGFDEQLREGLKGTAIGAGAGGWLQSGAAIKGAIRFGTDLQNRFYNQYLDRSDRYGTYADQFANQERGYNTDQYYNYLNALTGQQNVGLGAVNALAGVGTNYTNSVMNNNNQGAAAAANAALAKGAAQGQMYAGIGSALGQGLGYASGNFGAGYPWQQTNPSWWNSLSGM